MASSDVDPDITRANARKGQAKRAQKGKGKDNTTYIALGIFGGIVALVVGLLVLNPELPHNLIPALDLDFIETQNSLGLSFTQGPNSHFQGWNLQDVKQAMQTYISQNAKMLSPCPSLMSEGELLSESYDVREEWPICMEEIMVQGNCSSAYAITAAQSLSERLCIQNGGQPVASLSVQDILSCDSQSNGCIGGNIDTVWNHIKDIGIVDNQCFPYTSNDFQSPDCSQKCESGRMYKAAATCATATEQGIMREIQANGPVVAVLQVYNDLLGYKGGIYRPHIAATKIQGVHSVEIVGWGTDPDTKENYWTVKNSWGRDWGENGYGRIARGLSDFGLEDVVVAPIPWLERLDEPTIEVIQTEVENLDEPVKLEKEPEKETPKKEEKPKKQAKQ